MHLVKGGANRNECASTYCFEHWQENYKKNNGPRGPPPWIQ